MKKKEMDKKKFLEEADSIMKQFGNNLDYFRRDRMNTYHMEVLDGMYGRLSSLLDEYRSSKCRGE